MKKRIISLLLTVIMLAACLAGCTREDDGSGGVDTPDEGKTAVYVGIWDGGYGYEWAERYEKEFEALYANTSFEEGKMGVDVIVTPSKAYLTNCSTNLGSQIDDIMFIEQESYYDHITAGTVYDITSWVTEPLTEFGESKSIEDKLSALDKEYYGQMYDGKDAQYYALPWYESFSCMNYDIKLFEDNLLYLAAEGEGDEDGFITSLDDTRSNGPDGTAGTDDDGLAATYDDFFKILDKMVECGITPFIWAGSVPTYVNQLYTALVADIEGYDNMVMNYNFTGTATDLVKEIKDDGTIVFEDPTVITQNNGYMLKQQVGNYYALSFIERLFSKDENGDYKYFNASDCVGTSTSHTTAQAKFLTSTKSNPIAILVDGTWWYNEASAVFESMESTPGMGQKERKIGIMALPKPTADYVGEETTYIKTWVTTAVVNKNIEKKSEGEQKAIKLLYQYMHTDKALSSFIVDAEGIRPFQFELTGVTEADFSPYALQQYKISQEADIVNPYSSHYLIRNYYNTLCDDVVPSTNATSEFIIRSFGNDPDLTAKDYFLGTLEYWSETAWKRYLTGTFE